MLLVVSFFVLFTIRKIDTEALKAFGYVLAVMLWICAALALSCGMYTLATGRCPIMKAMMKQKMEMMRMHKSMMGSMGQEQMEEKMRCK